MKQAISFVVALGLLAGCERKDESVAKRAGDKVGQAVTDFASGVGQGVDKRMEVSVELSSELAARGVEKTVAKSLGIESTDKGIVVYLIARDPLKTRLIAKAMNKEGQEVGRSVVDVEFGADDAQYVTFKFDAEIDTRLVHRYHLDIENDTPGNEQVPGGETEGAATEPPAEDGD